MSVIYGCIVNTTLIKEDGFYYHVNLPTCDDVKNPLYSSLASQYVKNTWLKKVSLFSRGIVDVVEKAKGMTIEDNNQGSEGIFKNTKYFQDVHKHVDEPGLYINYRFEDDLKSNKLIYQQLKLSNSTLTKKAVNQEKKN